jgi:RNA polymerase sigma-70 factor (ECF subfamily)
MPADSSGSVLATDESQLLADLRAGDSAAFERVVREQGGRMLAVARRYLRNEEDARDAVQDAFLSAYRARASFEGGSKLSTWLHRIVVNASLMKLRTRRRKPEESIEELLPHYLEDGHPVEPAAPWRSLETEVDRRRTRELVRAAIDRLPESYRTVLMLRDIEGLDTSDAAEALGITETNVKVRLHRARQALRGLLDPELRGQTS